MFSKIKRLLGNITVNVKKNAIYVDGIPADVIAKDIKRIWGNRVLTNLFNKIDDNSFSFDEYFAVDIVYAIDTLLSEKGMGTSKHTLSKIKDLLLEHTWLANLKKEYPSKLNYHKLENFHYTPLPEQHRFFTAYDQITQQFGLNGLLLAAAAGGGKSIGSMMLVECLEVDQVIVVSPKNAVNRVWETTIKTGMKTIPTNWIVGSGKEFKGNENYIVFNYEYLTKFIELSGKLSGKKIAVILDESHNFNTHDSLRTIAFIEMCKKIKAAEVVWLSGTPIKALATEAIPLFRAIDPKFTEDVEARFKKIFGVSSERGTDILKNRLGYALFIVEKKEQNLQEPEFREIKVKIPNSEIYTLEAISKQMYAFTQERLAYYKSRAKEDNDFFNKCLDSHQRTLRTANDLTQFEFYKRCLKIVIKSGGDVRMAKEEIIYCNKYEHTKIMPTLAKEVKADFKNVKSIIKYVKLKIMGECLGRIVGGARIACNVELCKYVDYVAILENSPKKTIVFTSFVEVVETLQPHLENLGLESLFVYAKTNNKLAAIVDRFEKDEDANPLVATFASLSTAVPLIMADQMVMLNQPYRSYMIEQTVARINRIGATTQAKVFNVVLDTDNIPNISSRSFDIARWSAQQVQAITGVVSSIDFSEDMEQSNLALEGLLPEEPNDSQAMPSYLSW